MKKFEVTSRYWEELEPVGGDGELLEIVRNAVHAHVTRTIHPGLHAAQRQVLRAAGPVIVVLDADGVRQTLEVAEFVPSNPATGRSFAFMRQTYYPADGVCVAGGMGLISAEALLGVLEVCKMKYPSVADILRRRGFNYEARLIDRMVDAMEKHTTTA